MYMNLIGVALKQPSGLESGSIIALGVRAHTEQRRDLAGAGTEAMEANELLESVHGDPAHLGRITIWRRLALLGCAGASDHVLPN